MSQSQTTIARSRPPWYFYVLAASYLGYFVLFFHLLFAGPYLGFGTDSAGTVVSVVAASPAERAGVQTGDRWVGFGGGALGFTAAFDVIRMLKVGDSVALRFRRNGQDFNVMITATSHRVEFPGLRLTLVTPILFSFLVMACVIALLRPQDVIARIGALFLASMSVFLPPAPGLDAALQRSYRRR